MSEGEDSLVGRDALEGRDVDVFDALAELLVSSAPRRVPLDELVAVAAAADPDLDVSPDRRARLSKALAALEAAGVARPAGRSRWDRSGTPALPLDVRGPAADRSSITIPVPGDLRPELAAAVSLGRVTERELEALRTVNGWLRDFDLRRPVVPSRERSWEIFGDEKRLDVLAAGRLFRDSVLSFELLGCEPVHPPFVHEQVGDSPTLLVVENHHSYASMSRALHQRNPALREPRQREKTRQQRKGGVGLPPIGAIGYGAGHLFEASVTYAADLVPRPTRILYFGDLDEQGLAIPARADERAQAAGLAGVEPAARLYEALLEQRTALGRAEVDFERAVALAAWLPEELRGAAVRMLTSGRRIPQESVGYEQLGELLDAG